MRRSGLRRYGAGGEAFDIDLSGAALPLLDPLNEAEAFLAGVQLCQEPDRLFMAAVQVLLYLVQGVVDEHTPHIVIPAVFGGQAHAVQQEAVQEFCVCGQLFERLPGNELPGNTVESKLIALVAIVIIEVHVLPPVVWAQKKGTTLSTGS